MRTLLWVRRSLGLCTGSLILGQSSPSSAVVTAAADAPRAQPAPAIGPPAGVTPKMGTTNPSTGVCVATADVFTPKIYGDAENAAHMACLETLEPSRPV